MYYEEFKKLVIAKFKDYIAEPYKDYDIKEMVVDKTNQKKDAFTLIDSKNKNSISPTLYIDDMYEHYKTCQDFNVVMHTAAVMYSQGMDEAVRIGNLDWDSAKNNIVFQLINTEQNKDVLANVPHRTFQDLSIVYRWILSEEFGSNGSRGTILVQNELASKLKLNEEQLYNLAKENTEKLFPTTIVSMKDEMINMLKAEMGTEDVEMFIQMMGEPDIPMWIVSNKQKFYGAAAVLDEEKLFELASSLDDNLYLIPSSIHEMLALPESTINLEDVASMVPDVNSTQVKIEERLSNQVYRYDKKERCILLATDTPNKRLDNYDDYDNEK